MSSVTVLKHGNSVGVAIPAETGVRMGLEVGQELTLIELAFLDGNKRTAWANCTLFLKANGVDVVAPAADAVENTLALATGVCRVAARGHYVVKPLHGVM